MPLTLISGSGEQYQTIKEIMEAMAKVSFQTKADNLDDAIYPRQGQNIYTHRY
jgi:hypothetical protein